MKRRNFLMAVAGAVAAVPLAKTVTEAEAPHGSVTAIESGQAHLEGIVLPAQSSVSQWRDTSGFLNTVVTSDLPMHTHPLPAFPLSWEARMHEWLEDRATLDRTHTHVVNIPPHRYALVSRDFSFSEGTLAQMPDAEIKARAEFLTNKIE